jgi:hypothetical protein
MGRCPDFTPVGEGLCSSRAKKVEESEERIDS